MSKVLADADCVMQQLEQRNKCAEDQNDRLREVGTISLPLLQ
jgi:hypothetical protein